MAFACTGLIYAQDPNPQTSFATTVLYANPSLYLNFNDQTTAFKDQISGLRFMGRDKNSEFSHLPSTTYAGYF